MARRGARVLDEDPNAPRAEFDTSRRRPPVRNREDVWVFEGPVDDAPPEKSAARAPARRSAGSATSVPNGLPSDVTAEIAEAVGKRRAAQLATRMASAVRAYERDRYTEALRISKALADEVPESASVRELHGLVCYRLGRWKQAIEHLTAARTLSGDDPSQLPVLMDCHRALRQHRRVATLWEELRTASPDADVLAEGRMVLAADLADRHQLQQAIDLLADAGAGRNLRRPSERHLRQWYVLADLSERAGDLPRARLLFARVVAGDPELADAPARLLALGTRRGPRRRDPSGSRR